MNRGSIKIAFCIGMTCLMLVGCQKGIRDYIGAVGLTRVHADELIVYPCIPLTEGRVSYKKPTVDSFIEKLGRSIREALYASAREVYESRRIREASASDRGSDVGADDVVDEGYVLPQEDGYDVGEYIEVASDDSEPEVDFSSYEEPADDYSEEPAGYGEYLGQFTATAYCSCPICTGVYSTGYTASGTLATEGRTVACNVLPLGSVVSINGNTYIVEDTGWTPYGDAWVDIYFDSHDAALAFGVQTVDVYLIG